MNKVDNFRLQFPNDNKEYVPIMIGGMGVDISSTNKFLGRFHIGATWQTSTKWIYYTECSPIR